MCEDQSKNKQLINERSVLLMIKKEDFPQKNIDFLLHKVESNALLWQS